MADIEFTATGVRIGRCLRSLTRAGRVVVREGRLELQTSAGREIDSAPAGSVRAAPCPFLGRDRAVASVNGTWYLLTLAERRAGGGTSAARRFVDALRSAAGRPIARPRRELRGPLPGATLDSHR